MTEPDPTAGFCGAAAARTARLRKAIADHPYNVAFTDGSLEGERFAFFLVQDGRYLISFSRSLALIASRAPDDEAEGFFLASAHTALVVERSLHGSELSRLGWSEQTAESLPTSPTCLAYSSFLTATAATEAWPVAVAAVLPCFWVYAEVGNDIAARTQANSNHPYRAWIETYSDEGFAASVATMRGIVDQAAAAASPAVVARMTEHFCRATSYEWMFWDSAWRLEAWPTAAWLS